MNFQNSYILIFNKDIAPKTFIKWFFYIILFLFLMSVFIKNLNIVMNSNDLIKNYQIQKIQKLESKNLDTIIVGDSSAGNAINAELFSKLTGQDTVNLSLTGSWGIVGSLGLIKKVYSIKPEIKSVIIIQTLDIWNRPFSDNSIHELFSLNDRLNILGLKSIINNEINLKEIKWFSKYIKKKLKNENFPKIDFANDYLMQKKKKQFKSFKSLKMISSGKIKEFKLLENFCNSKKLNCIFFNGPIHENVINKSEDFFLEYNSFMKKSNIIYFDKIFQYKDNIIGDSLDHISPDYKDSITKEYAIEIKKYLK